MAEMRESNSEKIYQCKRCRKVVVVELDNCSTEETKCKECEREMIYVSPVSDEAYFVRHEILVRNQKHCFHLEPIHVQTVINLYNDYLSRNKEKSNIGKLLIDVDVSDALTGLKAITREAKKSTEALKELEEQQKKMNKAIDWAELGGKLVGIDGPIIIDGLNDKLTLAVKSNLKREQR